MSTSMVVGPCTILCTQGDITTRCLGPNGAIVNAANPHLWAGGGVCGAIHDAGGEAIADDLQRKGHTYCKAGEAVASVAGRLDAKYVLHAVGPNLCEGEARGLLRDVYQFTLRLASQLGVDNIAAPAICTGIFGYPIEEAARVSLCAVSDFFGNLSRAESEQCSIKRFEFVLYDQYSYSVFSRELDSLQAEAFLYGAEEQIAEAQCLLFSDDNFIGLNTDGDEEQPVVDIQSVQNAEAKDLLEQIRSKAQQVQMLYQHSQGTLLGGGMATAEQAQALSPHRDRLISEIQTLVNKLAAVDSAENK